MIVASEALQISSGLDQYILYYSRLRSTRVCDCKSSVEGLSWGGSTDYLDLDGRGSIL